ncbi:MAG: SBBP repeat-containing protein [Candidatus Tectomicrobia bacterium]|uniref:SBBP repeat-containing protein n=1 Tax=Tectimicrobiota bacterium TaxID=2528274 RepID=A0A932GNQ6_UNCTE|nr:SBBP repeat-containing protein [Candidatus Tectomicrobia bacterium]
MKRRELGQSLAAISILFLVILPVLADAGTISAAANPAPGVSRVAYNKLPLIFEANRGQTDAQVKFLSRGHGYTLFLTSTEAVLALRKPQAAAQKLDSTLSPSPRVKGSLPLASPRAEDRALSTPPSPEGSLKSLPTAEGDSPLSPPPTAGEGQGGGAVLRMKLVGANPDPRVVGREELPGKSNYFIGNDPKKWRTNVSTYARIEYRDVYPGVNLVYYGNQGQLEYDFIVAPGADPAAIRLSIGGADKQEIDDQGHLVLHAAGGQIRLHKPLVYQEVDGVRKFIPGRYVLIPSSLSLLPSGEGQSKGTIRIGFEVAAYDASKPLVIDPVLSYSTYLGGTGADFGNGIAVDSSGNMYVTGYTASANFPTANPVPPGLNAGGYDAFVTKLSATGALVYSTYLGGSGDDRANGIAVDGVGNAYVVGSTNPLDHLYSNDFPTKEALQAQFGGHTDAFVTKLNASGGLVYSTYLGGLDYDGGFGIAVDAAGNVYITGDTWSDTFPTTPGAFQPALSGPAQIDAFVAKLNAAGSGLVYSTYLGGNGGVPGYGIAVHGYGIAVDASGNAYVTGDVNNGWEPDRTKLHFPTVNAFQATYGGGSFDAFVTKLNASGSALVYSTYLGGSGQEHGYGIAVDGAGAAYVAGWTLSSDFPTRAGSFQTVYGGSTDAFVTKLSATGGLVYSSYLGGSFYDEGFGIAVDASGNAYVTGWTGQTFTTNNFPTVNPFQTAMSGFTDAFVAKLNDAGSALVYSTYLGGSGGETGFGIAVDASGNAYVTGSTGSSNFPTTSGPFGPGGGDDAFIAKITAAVPNRDPVADAGPDQTVEGTSPSGARVTLDSSGSSDPDGDVLTYTWIESGNMIGSGKTIAVTLSMGTHVITLTVDDGKDGTASDTVTVKVQDTTAPLISSVSASPSVLWPPNRRMVPVTVAVSVSDICDGAPRCRIVSVTSNEPVSGLGRRDRTPDWEITGDLTMNLRAERSAKGRGRVYTITIRCADASGNSSTKTTTVTVPHKKPKKEKKR